ncbi:MAG: hypothetical protein HQ564_01150 [Candidatus Saganbacteria bacterium]|nr:hypothetical protein [Candidatus Saganbacteria bacterium]
MLKLKLISFNAKRALEGFDGASGQEMLDLIDSRLFDPLIKTNILRNAGVPIAIPLLKAALSNKTKKVSLKEFLVGSQIPDPIPLDYPFKIIKKLKNLTPLIRERKKFSVGDGIEIEILDPNPDKFEIKISGIKGQSSSWNSMNSNDAEGETTLSIRASFLKDAVFIQPDSGEMSLEGFMACSNSDPNEENISMSWSESSENEHTSYTGAKTGHFTTYHSSYEFEGFNLKNVIRALLKVLLPLTV